MRELLAAPRSRAVEVWVAEDVAPSAVIDEIVELAVSRRVPLRRVGRARLEGAARTEAPQGVLARARPLEEVDLEELARGGRRGPPFLVVLDGVTDPHNLGNLLRSALCAGATGAVLARHRAVHVTPAAAKAAAGAIEHLPIALVPGVPSALEVLTRSSVWLVGLEAAAPLSLFDLDLAGEAMAVVVGGEGRGLGRLTARRCDVLAAIPLAGPLDSLNVAAAGAVACFTVARARRGVDSGGGTG